MMGVEAVIEGRYCRKVLGGVLDTQHGVRRFIEAQDIKWAGA